MHHLPFTIASIVSLCTAAHAQLVVEASFNPTQTGTLCGAAFGGDVWAYGCFAATIDRYSPGGALVSQFPRPGGGANDVDLDIAYEVLDLGGIAVPAGSLLYIDGESGTAEVYALDSATGALLATLNTQFGNSHVVGGAYHPTRDTLFLLQDGVPGATNGNLVAEVDPVTGAVLNTFSTAASFAVNFGDLDASRGNGNLFVVSSTESTIAEFSPTGTLIREHFLPAGVSGLSGIGIDDSTGKAWVGSATSGALWLLGGVVQIGTPYCGPAAANSTGLSGELRAFGSPLVADDNVLLRAADLPQNQFGYFLNSLSQGAAMPPGSQGTLCLSGSIGRYNATVQNTGTVGGFTLALDLATTPTPTGPVAVAAGETWHFQCWYRDVNPTSTSNFTDAVMVTFR